MSNKDYTMPTQRELMDMFVRDKMREKEKLKEQEKQNKKD